MPSTEVKQLLLTVDATVELLRKNMLNGEAAVKRSTDEMQRRLDNSDRRFERFGKPLTGIGSTINQVNRQVATLGTSVEAVERRMRASSAGIRSALLASTAGVAAAFSVKQVQELADGYNRFTNQLKVAGLEGGNLASVQQQLFEIAQRNGAPLEAIGTLYGRASQAGKALGASQADLIRFSGAVGAALKVQGGSAEEAQGALLQLAQALGSGTVHAEEFNSVNEGLRPILQAAAEASDKYRGNVALLRADVIAQKVSSQELFRLILAGYDSLQTKASKAGLTIGSSFTVLTNALSQAIGQTDAALGATDRLSGGITFLADNLGTVIPALASIAAGYGVVKAGRLAWTAATAAGGAALQSEQALLGQTAAAIAAGNASYVSNTTLKAKAAAAAADTAAAEVAAIETRIAAERAEAAQLEVNLALIERQRAEAKASQAAITASQALGFGTLGQGGATRTGAQLDAGRALKAEQVTTAALTGVKARLAASETELAAAKIASTTATKASTAATTASTVAARVSAGVTGLLSGAMATLTAALPIIAVGALVAVFLHYRQEAAEAEAQTKAFADRANDAKRVLAETAPLAAAAAGGIAQVGTSAVVATGKVAAFAGKVGEAAEQLRQLADQKRKAALGDLQTQGNAAELTINQTRARIAARTQSADSVARFGYIPNPSRDAANAADRKALADAQTNLRDLKQRYQTIAGAPLERLLPASALTGGVDVQGELARLRNDLRIAKAAGDKRETNRLGSQVYQLTQYQAYRKQGLSDETARSKSNEDADRLRTAGQGRLDSADAKRSSSESAKAARAAAAEKRKEEAAVRDAAGDARAYAAGERQANDQIAAAHADLTNSAAERAQIERDRIRADVKSKNEELQLQAKQGRFGTGKEATDRVASLQALNTRAGDAQIAVVDRKEEQRVVDEGVDVATANLSAQRQILQDASSLATTAAQRRAIELRILDLQFEEERLRLEAVVDARSNASDGERKRATIDLGTLDARKASAAAVVVANTRGNAEGFRERLRTSATDVGDAIDGIKVSAIDSLSDGLENAAGRFIKLGGIAGDVASTIISSFAKIAIEKYLVPSLGGALGLSGGGKASTPGFADGGTPSRSGNRISGPGDGTSDSILALLPNGRLIRVSNGESIVTAQGTRDHWPLIDAINRGRLPRFATGGAPTPIFAARAPDVGGVASSRGDRRPINFDLRGAVMTDDLLRQMQAIAIQTGGQAYASSVEHTNRSLADMNRTRL